MPPRECLCALLLLVTLGNVVSCSTQKVSASQEIRRTAPDDEHPNGRVWTPVPIMRRGATVYMEFDRQFPETQMRVETIWDPATGKPVREPTPPTKVIMAELLVDVTDPSLLSDSDKDMGSWIETWLVNCSRRIGAYSAAAGYTGSMGQGESLGVGDMFPVEDDYKKSQEVDFICDTLSRDNSVSAR